MKILKVSGCAVIFLMEAFIAVGCNTYTAKNKNPTESLSANDLNNPTYAIIHTKIIQPYCVMCHGHDGGVTLESFADVSRYIEPIRSSVLTRSSMPPGEPLAGDLKALLVTWIANGHPENGVPVELPPVEQLVPTFSSISKNILEPKCAACHDSASDNPILDYAYLIESQWVKPRDLEGSPLFQSILKGEMPPDEKLSDEEIKSISTWIMNGAPND